MKIGKCCAVVAVVFALGLMVGPAFAVVAVPVDPSGDGIEEISDDGNLVATIHYTSDFEVLDYNLGDTIRINVDITDIVTEPGYTIGPVTYVDAYLRAKGNNFTPKNRVTGTFEDDGDSWIEFDFDTLKEAGDGSIGNAHFHMEFEVEWSDGNGGGVETVKLGINCHAETQIIS